MKTIQNKELYVPFYDYAIATQLRANLQKKLFINVYLKGGRFSGKSYYVVNQIIELMYLDPARSTIVIAMTLTDHQERGVILFDKILTELGLHKEWKWRTKKTRPVLVRNVNGFKQEIRFLSLADLETAGFEPPINESTGKHGYYGILWNDEMSKKTDNNPDADFAYIHRLKDAIQTAKNTFIRHMNDRVGNQAMITFNSLNPWGEGNPLVKDFHQIMGDDFDKLVKHGYNIGYHDDDETYTIVCTTNFKINTKLSDKAKKSIRSNRKDPRAATIIYGVTGKVMNSKYGYELGIMESLSRGGNLPKDIDFLPVNMSVDVGTSAPTMFYLNGFDMRSMVKFGGNYFPTRIVTKAEYAILPKVDLRPLKERYLDLLRHIQKLSIRFPQIKKGIELYVDGSAKDTIELWKAYIEQLNNESPYYDLGEWLQVIPQDSKWKASEKRIHREERFSELVGNYGLIVDINECPVFYDMTSNIVSVKSEALYDHGMDALMYGIMPIYKKVYAGIQIKAIQNKPDILESQEIK